MAGLDIFAVADLVNAVSAVAFLALGVVVLAARPRTRASLLFAAFAILAGATAGVLNILNFLSLDGSLDPLGPVAEVLRTVFALAPLFLLLFAWGFPQPPTARIRRRILVAAGATAYASVVVVTVVVGLGADSEFVLFMTQFLAAWWALGVALLWMALRYADPELGSEDRRAIAIVAGAIGLYWSAYYSVGITNFVVAALPPGFFDFPELFRWSSIARASSPLLVSVVWLWTTATVAPDATRGARNVALMLQAGMAIILVKELLGVDTLVEIGITRLVMVLLIAYAVLRGQLPGFDLKIRWGISKTTVAAVFIAVFFIVSEAAQEFFDGAFNSGYLGILAAGALVFAMAPLSRLADRLAERAVPIAPAPPGATGSTRLGAEVPDAVYRAAVRAAMRDGVLTRREEVHLAEIAEGLGIGPLRALAIRGEVEEEAG